MDKIDLALLAAIGVSAALFFVVLSKLSKSSDQPRSFALDQSGRVVDEKGRVWA